MQSPCGNGEARNVYDLGRSPISNVSRSPSWLGWLSFLFKPFCFIAPKTYYLAYQSFDFERTWWRLFLKPVVRTKFDIYVLLWNVCITRTQIFVCLCQIPCFSLFATTDRAWLIIWFQTRITRHVLLEEQDSPRILLEIVFFILCHYTFLHVVSSVFIFIYVYPSVRRHADDFRLCRT